MRPEFQTTRPNCFLSSSHRGDRHARPRADPRACQRHLAQPLGRQRVTCAISCSWLLVRPAGRVKTVSGLALVLRVRRARAPRLRSERTQSKLCAPDAPRDFRNAWLDRPSSWGLGCLKGGLVARLSRQEIPRGKQRHMLHQYEVSGCRNELSAETPCEIMALRCAGAGRKDGCSSSGRAPPGTWLPWQHKHRGNPHWGGNQSTHPPLRRK
jgi:hypothetical protein